MSISIPKNPIPSRGIWTEEYRIKDKDIIEKVNEIWQRIIKNS